LRILGSAVLCNDRASKVINSATGRDMAGFSF
jgi:hypothetical protein